MKILYVIPCFYPEWTYGGPVRVAYDYAKELVKNGHEVTVYTSDNTSIFSPTGVRTVVVNGIQIYYFKNFSKLIAKKMKLYITPNMAFHIKNQIRTFDIVHFHEYRTFQNVFVYHYVKRFSIPYVIQVHGSILSIGAKQHLKKIFDKMIGFKFLRDATKVIAISEAEAEQYNLMGVSNSKIVIISNSLNVQKNLPLSKGNFKEKFAIACSEKIILYLGRVHELKGIDFIIAAFTKLISDGFANVRLVIAGPDDGYLRSAKRLVASNKCSSKVLFSGPLTEADKIFAYVDSSVVVYPERYNVFGIVPLEAAAFKRPVIVSKENYMNNIVREGAFGFSVKYGDVDSLFDLLKLAVTDEQLMDQMGLRGRKFVIDNFSLNSAIEKLKQLYISVLSK